jgi:hypothetical protein
VRDTTCKFQGRVARKFPCVESSVSTRPSAERVKLREVKGPKLRRNVNFDLTLGVLQWDKNLIFLLRGLDVKQAVQRGIWVPTQYLL